MHEILLCPYLNYKITQIKLITDINDAIWSGKAWNGKKPHKHNGPHRLSENETFGPELNDEIRLILICYIHKAAEISYSRDYKTKT
ncbi:hypothetical protein ROHU_027197 [Labeo rohita]|uniref:Uncharacterized protein n=1 Tax=Labeo rohita TaxID=84645 RepID=A0A498M8A1_LABRO|nr:hypothetical protein ROHU_027197 [Labeo rohita]